jgi:hypothetical protein
VSRVLILGANGLLDPYRDSAAVIEASDLDYTILRPGWFTRDSAVDYRITQKGEPFIGHDVSLHSVSGLIEKLAMDPAMGGIHETDRTSRLPAVVGRPPVSRRRRGTEVRGPCRESNEASRSGDDWNPEGDAR